MNIGFKIDICLLLRFDLDGRTCSAFVIRPLCFLPCHDTVVNRTGALPGKVLYSQCTIGMLDIGIN